MQYIYILLRVHFSTEKLVQIQANLAPGAKFVQNDSSGLPDFCWRYIPKREKLPQKKFVWLGVCQMTIKIPVHNIYDHFPFQSFPKICIPKLGLLLCKYTIWQPCGR
jgi:hypothetical protein